MSRSSGTVIERTRVREVAGVFRSREALDAATEALLLAGFDRADIDVIGDLSALRQRLGAAYVAAEELADMPRAPRRPYFAREDVAAFIAVAAGTLAAIGAMAIAYGIIVSGGKTALAIGAAGVAAGASAGVVAFLISRAFERERTRGLEWLAAAHGLVLWVRVRSSDQEEMARDILTDHGAEAVRVHEVDLEKGPEDIPLSSLRPDPWLGSESLGQP